MVVRTFVKPALPLLTLLPGLCLIPVLAILVRDGHGGGMPLLIEFAQAAVQPSFDPTLLQSLWQGLQITFMTAVLSWAISSGLGLIFGFLGSRTLWRTVLGNPWPAVLVRRLLSPFRAIHELIWGLLLLQVYGLNGWVAIAAIVIPYSALMARVLADQIDCHESPALPVLQASGGSAMTGPSDGCRSSSVHRDQTSHWPSPRLRFSISFDPGCVRAWRAWNRFDVEPSIPPIQRHVEWVVVTGHRHGVF
jgi:phosphonate transport system permease protein